MCRAISGGGTALKRGTMYKCIEASCFRLATLFIYGMATLETVEGVSIGSRIGHKKCVFWVL